MFKHTFVNEIGNKITVKSKLKNGVGVNHKSGEKLKYKGIEIQLIGPTSMSSNHVTINEAIEIYNAIGEQLKKLS